MNIKKNADAEVVKERLLLAREEAEALVAQGATLPADDAPTEDDGMTAEERAELEAELAEMGDDLEEPEIEPETEAAPVAASVSTAIGATAEAAHKAVQLERCREARAAVLGKAEQAMAAGTTSAQCLSVLSLSFSFPPSLSARARVCVTFIRCWSRQQGTSGRMGQQGRETRRCYSID